MSTPTSPSSPRVIFFTDFDGTVTRTDPNITLIDTFGCGRAARLEREAAVVRGADTFRDAWTDLSSGVAANIGLGAACDWLLANDAVAFDPAFTMFWEWCAAPSHRTTTSHEDDDEDINNNNNNNNDAPRFVLGVDEKIDVVILSGGIDAVIERLLDGLLRRTTSGRRWDLRIVSNHARAVPGSGGIDEAGGWEIAWRDNSRHGHDKAVEIRKFSQLPADQRPLMFYAGDGLSDYSAARETDLLFAKKGAGEWRGRERVCVCPGLTDLLNQPALVEYCETEYIPHIPFDDFSLITEVVQKIVGGKLTVQGALARYGKTYTNLTPVRERPPYEQLGSQPATSYVLPV